MKKNKEIKVMTPFGPVPYKAIKKYLPKKICNRIDELLSSITEPSIPMNEEFYIHRLAERTEHDTKEVIDFLDSLTELNPALATQLLLKEIALDFDSDYKGNIEDSEEIWTISMLNGKVVKVDKSKVKNYRNFAAFRTQNDAQDAHRILSKRLRKMFRGCGKQ